MVQSKDRISPRLSLERVTADIERQALFGLKVLREIAVPVINLSPEGMKLVLPGRRSRNGQMVKISLRLPSMTTKIKLEAEVRWSKRLPGHAQEVGTKFCNLEPTSLALLNRYVEERVGSES